MAVVAFDSAAFKVRYPIFVSVSDALLSAFFEEAGLYLSNSDASPVQNVDRRESLLWMLVAHLAALNGAISKNMAAPVGRASSASEGSVSASFDYVAATPGSGAWFNQTQYGASFWQATSSLRSMRYIPRKVIY